MRWGKDGVQTVLVELPLSPCGLVLEGSVALSLVKYGYEGSGHGVAVCIWNWFLLEN